MKDTATAEFIALSAILAAVISGGLNLHLWNKANDFKALSETQQVQIETMERTLLLTTKQ
jgi:hypothetical protein